MTTRAVRGVFHAAQQAFLEAHERAFDYWGECSGSALGGIPQDWFPSGLKAT